MPATRDERLKAFFRRLAQAPAAGSEAEALDALARVLNEVEDELSGVTFDAGFPLNDGRMYPPKTDARRSVSGRPDLARYRSRGHNTFISSSGAIRIQTIGGKCEFEKPGADGNQIGKI